MRSKEIVETLQAVQAHREIVAGLQGVLRQRKQQFEADNKELLDSLEANSLLLTEVEEDLRALGLATFRETGEKKPAPGIGIRIMLHLEYDAAEALIWAKKHDMALALDRKLFEQIARVQNIPFVKKTEKPQVTIATDLTSALAMTNLDNHLQELAEMVSQDGIPLKGKVQL